MSSTTEEMNFKFYFILIILNLKTDSWFNYWKALKYVGNKSDMCIYYLKCKFYEILM